MKDGSVLETFRLEDEETNDLTTSKLNKFNKPFLINDAAPDDIGQYSCSVDNGIQNVLIQRHFLFPSLSNLSTETIHVHKEKELYLSCLVIVDY